MWQKRDTRHVNKRNQRDTNLWRIFNILFLVLMYGPCARTSQWLLGAKGSPWLAASKKIESSVLQPQGTEFNQQPEWPWKQMHSQSLQWGLPPCWCLGFSFKKPGTEKPAEPVCGQTSEPCKQIISKGFSSSMGWSVMVIMETRRKWNNILSAEWTK